ncbi:zinc finger CCCH domain-containing protein 18-like isoform X2 [Bacillus rossius redtenbacheri]|uniref:zinc finger CCCH domain-containing protein 18-like isoform X2 n=1 Tax=Bacillus rossius redtenbacheri TaxID=93214 RepID=UPI002FDDB7A6
MESDSSLDGEFESKHEVAVRGNSAAGESESDVEENDESDYSSTGSEDEKDSSADPLIRVSSPLSRDEDGSDSEAGKHSQSPVHFTPRSPSLYKETSDCGGAPNLTSNNFTPGSYRRKLSPSFNPSRHLSSSEDEKNIPSSEDGNCTPSSEDGNHSPSSDDGNHSPNSQTGRHSPNLQIGKNTLSSRTGKQSLGSRIGKLSTNSEMGKSSPTLQTKQSPSSQTGKQSPSLQTETHASSLKSEIHSPSLQTEILSPRSQTEILSPSSRTEIHSPSSHTEKRSLDLKDREYSRSPTYPQSPSFHDEQNMRSPDPGKCTPCSEPENHSPYFGRAHSPVDRSPSTDYGKQSPGSGHGRWTPSPDHGTQSPKRSQGRASEMGEESVGSFSGIRSPSLNGDTRSSRAWSPPPERDKHFHVTGQEAHTATAEVPVIRSPTPESNDRAREMISRSGSGVLVADRDGRKQSPELSCKELSPKSHLSELSPALNRKKNSLKSRMSHSPDSNDEETSPKTNEKNLAAGPASPDSNDDGELSDSSRDAIVKPNKLTRQDNGEKVKEKFQTNGESDKTAKQANITSHGEDLSDVSDLEINDGAESIGEVVEEGDKKASKGAPPTDDGEQLDFEAEEREEGECEAREDGKSEDEGELKGEELEEGELTDDDENRPEETEPRHVCRFYTRGQCTWGPNCRFLHPGVTDKGNYTMFDMLPPVVTINGPPIYPMEYRVPVPVPVPVPYEKPAPAMPYQGPRKEVAPVFESAWERGLRQAKEMMRKSSKRKEMDIDFEEKKMNLSLGQEELDKENDYYTRQTSPIKDEAERWRKAAEPDGKYVREGSVFEEYPTEHPYYHQHSRGDYWRRVQYEPSGGDSRSAARVESSDYRSSSKYRRSPSDHYYDKYEKKKKSSSLHSTREVIMQRVEKPWREDRYTETTTTSSHRARGDEWADPWMRSKSPTGRKGTSSRPTRKSYSSGSSYSSTSSSRSSSRSSYSSYSRDSHSRSRSKSLSHSRSRSRSRSPAARRRKPTRPLVPTARAAVAAGEAAAQTYPRAGKLVPELRTLTKAKPTTAALLTASEKKAVTERAPLMNPPAPTPRKSKDARPPSPGMMRKVAQNPPPPSAQQAGKPASGLKTALDRPKLTVAGAASIKAKMHSHSASSKSSSGSESSGSSSDSSESSYSSSSSSREPSPKVVRPQKRMVIDERERLAFAQTMKIKAMDALKLSGQKQQIKLTLKTPGSLGGSASIGAAAIKKPGTGLPDLPELNLVRRAERGVATLAGKKRPAEDSVLSDQAMAAKMAALSKPAAKKATSRREELLKQLKAVEDAIARKRSKIIP